MRLATTLLIFCVVALLSLGMVMLYSSSMADKQGAHYLPMQLIWCSTGLVACGLAASVDYRVLKKLVWPTYALAVILLALVLVPHIGHRVNGARRWFQLGGTKILVQPSELGKIALIIAVAWYGERYQRQMVTWKRGIVFPCLFIGLMLGVDFCRTGPRHNFVDGRSDGNDAAGRRRALDLRHSAGAGRRARFGNIAAARSHARAAHFCLALPRKSQGGHRLSGLSGAARVGSGWMDGAGPGQQPGETRVPAGT